MSSDVRYEMLGREMPDAKAVRGRPGTPLKVRMAALGVTTRALAFAVRVTEDYMCSVVNGRKTPSRRVRHFIAVSLDVPESELWPDEER